jgi:cytochrome c553
MITGFSRCFASGQLLLAACSLAALPLLAQPAKVVPAAGDDLRAIQATPQDVAEGKKLAQEACARCHGANGMSATAGIPHLAGQRAAYIHLQLRAYKAGERPQSPMAGAVKFLSDDALVKVAAHYASLEPPRAAPAPRAASGVRDPLQAGKAAAQACSGCHGENGVSAMAGTPSLVALDPKYFVAAMTAYKNGKRKHDMMKAIAAGISDLDLNGVALHYALLKPARAGTPAKGDAAAGKAAATSCAGCHGDNGVSGNGETPSLAGQDAEYFAAAMKAYKDGSRAEEAMKGIAGALDAKTVTDLAAYYAAQAPQPVAVRKPASLAEWAGRCDRCHGVNGNSIDPMIPALAAQRVDWLESVLNAYRTGARKSIAMTAMSSQLSEGEVKEIAAYYARQGARPVTYVVIPK